MRNEVTLFSPRLDSHALTRSSRLPDRAILNVKGVCRLDAPAGWIFQSER
jgi:hypothetical protein